jgi:hypothetical protein
MVSSKGNSPIQVCVKGMEIDEYRDPIQDPNLKKYASHSIRDEDCENTSKIGP